MSKVGNWLCSYQTSEEHCHLTRLIRHQLVSRFLCYMLCNAFYVHHLKQHLAKVKIHIHLVLEQPFMPFSCLCNTDLLHLLYVCLRPCFCVHSPKNQDLYYLEAQHQFIQFDLKKKAASYQFNMFNECVEKDNL